MRRRVFVKRLGAWTAAGTFGGRLLRALMRRSPALYYADGPLDGHAVAGGWRAALYKNGELLEWWEDWSGDGRMEHVFRDPISFGSDDEMEIEFRFPGRTEA